MSDNVDPTPDPAPEAPGWSDAPKCGRPTRAGGTCPRPVMPGSTACYTHGLPPGKRQPPRRQPDAALATLADELEAAETPAAVRAVLAQVAAGLIRGTVPASTAKLVNQLGNTILRAMTDDLTAELTDLKEALAGHASEAVRGWSKRRRRGAKP